jgi:hypothetical protein
MDVKITNLTNLRNKIEDFTLSNQKKILELLVKHNVIINETLNNSCINLSCISDNIIKELTDFVKLIELQETELKNVEDNRIELEKKYFTK